MSITSFRPVLLLLAFAWLGAGCAQQSQPSVFYLLSYGLDQNQSGSATTMREGVSLGIGPVELPQYLDRPQIVTRTSENQLEIEEFDRWGGRLRDNFTTVLTEVLSAELATDRVSTHPWSAPSPVDYQVIVQVMAFDTDMSGRSILDARWTVVDVRRQTVLATARSTLRQQVDAGGDPAAPALDYDAVAAAMSRNIADLGREIASQIRSFPAS